MSREENDQVNKATFHEIPVLSNSTMENWGSDRVARLLREFGLPYICFNPGASFRGLHDSLVNFLGNDRPRMPDVTRYKSIPSPAPSPDLLAEAGRLLNGAKSPVILSGRVSRSVEAWNERVKLAEQLNAFVFTDLKVGASFPSQHELHAMPRGMFISKESLGKLQNADVVLSLDWVDLAGTIRQAWPDRPCPAKIIQASVDHQLHNAWSFDHMPLPPVDVHLAVTPDAAVPLLRSVLPEPKRKYGYLPRTPFPAANGAIVIGEVAEALLEVADGRHVCLSRLPLSWDGFYWPLSHPLDQIGHSGGGGIGSGPGMAVGAALALKDLDRIAAAILGDGDYLMGVMALWSATHYQIPLLIVVANNHSYFNDEVHQERVARTRNRPVENRWIGQRIADPEPDVVMLARAQGAVGIGPIRERAQLKSALQEALDAVLAGKVVVVDVHVAPGYTPTTVAALTET